MSDPIRFTIYGKSQTAGSKRAFPFKRKNGQLGVSVSDDNPKSKAWKSVVSDAALKVAPGKLLTCPLSVVLVFYIDRPKGHYGTGRNADKLKPSAPEFPAKKPDVLKLARAIEDALTGVLWRDDAQIVDEVLCKRFGKPRCEVTVREMEPELIDA